MALWDWSADYFARDPWRELDQMRRRMDRILRGVGVLPTAEFPVVNVWSDAERAVVCAELPGVQPGDIDLSVDQDTLTIRGSREPLRLEEGETFLRHERGHGAFARTVTLPFPVEADRVDAGYKNGILTITLPRREAEKPSRIEIKG